MKRYAFENAPRCTARSKRTGCGCRAPAVNGFKVCRFHGARGGAPKGVGHGNYRNGLHTGESIAARKQVTALIKMAREFAADIDAGENL